MKTWKLVSGILSIVLFFVVVFQSCAAGIGDAMVENGGTGGAMGIMVAILMLAGGIVSIAVRNSTEKGGDIAVFIIFLLAALFAFISTGMFSDLKVWGAWCLICAILALVSCITKGKKQRK